MGVGLLDNIRRDRARQKKKRPYGRDSFNTVSCIVKAYGLDEHFATQLEEAKDRLSKKKMELSEVKAKKALELSLFSLVSKEEYEVASTIVSKLSNPYLPFAHSPDELLLSSLLYKANPSLGPMELLSLDFEALLLYQRAKEELADLEDRLAHESETAHGGKDVESRARERPSWGLVRDRMDRLKTFIAKVESVERQSR